MTTTTYLAILPERFFVRRAQNGFILQEGDPALGFQGWDTFIARLFVKADGYRAICKAKCHKAITEQQRLIRQEAKKNKL